MIVFVNGPKQGQVEYVRPGQTEVGSQVRYRVLHERSLALLIRDQLGKEYQWQMLTSTTVYAKPAQDAQELKQYMVKQHRVHPDTVQVTRHGRRLLAVGFRPLAIESKVG